MPRWGNFYRLGRCSAVAVSFMHFSYEGQVRTLPPDPENTSNDPLLDAMEMDSPSLMEMDPPSLMEMDSPTHYLHVMKMDSPSLMKMDSPSLM